MAGPGDTVDVFRWGRPLALLRHRIKLPPGSQVRHQLIGLQTGVDSFEFTPPADRREPVAELVARDIAAGAEIGVRFDLTR
ncbi:hypothetical protein C8D88_10563 [Lentzea atacamensis]|uniref:Uncharacterized protein n=1 Tax=Lentzea atacamensis TaxID=531938 RepID=A0A316I107_9PSEU|nr:hypothetical protein C8D88_10563 [Lentzea atacamensis]